MAPPAPDTIRDEIVRLAHRDLDFHAYARAGAHALRRAVTFDGVAAVAFDPATTLPVDAWADGSLTELHETDVAAFRAIAASGRRAARLSEAPVLPRPAGDELRVVCVGDTGMWGALLLRRESGAPDFMARDVDLLESLAGGFDEVQRARLGRDPAADAVRRDPGLVLLDDEDGIELANAAAAAWLDELGDGGRRPPLVVKTVAARARAIASGNSEVAATARIRAASGRWVLVSGSVLGDGARARTAVTLEPARAPEVAELVAEACGLTERERRVTRLVAQGLPTAAIAARLFLSTYTVQDHLKAIFEKLDVSSRGQLVAKLFVDPDQLAS